MKVLVIQHDPTDPPERLAGWLADAGAEMALSRAHLGDPIPDSTDGYGALISLGGEMGAHDDHTAPWLPAVRRLLAAATGDRTPVLGICLGAQLLAVATGGRVVKGADGPEIGAYLTAKRDAADSDPLFGPVPMTPDVMQYHYDVIETLPPGAVLLLSSTGYPHQTFRVGPAAWGVQFHIECSAATVRSWAAEEGRTGRRLGPMLDEAEQEMTAVWPGVVARFVALGKGRDGTGERLAGRRLPLTGSP